MIREFVKIAGQRHLYDRWAHHFLRDLLGYGSAYVFAYRMTGREKRPLLQIKQQEEVLFTLETGKPPVERHIGVPYLLLFTGDDWQLYDIHKRPILIACVPRDAAAADFKVLHAEERSAWVELSRIAQECDTDAVVQKLLSPAIMETLKKELNGEVPNEVLLHHVKSIITGATPLPTPAPLRKAS